VKDTVQSATPITSVAVLHATPDDFRHTLEGAHPDVKFHWISDLEQVDAVMSSAQPDAVFAIRKTGFGGPPHRRAAFFPGVRWVHVGGSGYEHLLPIERTDVYVTNGRGVMAPFVAETAISGMLALNGRFAKYFDQQSRKVWKSLAFRPLTEQTLLVVGLGAIGLEVAARAKSLGMRVIAITSRVHETHACIDEQYPLSQLAELLPRADVVSLHVRHTDETTHLIDAKALALMKPEAILINTARGAIVHERALVSALEEGQLGGAYLDVFEQEPLPQDSPLWTCRNLILSPHSADNIVGWAGRMAQFFSDNLARWNSGRPLLNVLAPAVDERGG
jgi:phosphoglycerate dehydrogenase-like enzyme